MTVWDVIKRFTTQHKDWLAMERELDRKVKDLELMNVAVFREVVRLRTERDFNRARTDAP